MRRRALIEALGGAMMLRPTVLRAQQRKQVIGFLGSGEADAYKVHLEAFRQGLRDAGYVEGENVAIEFRWAEGHYDRLADLATELVARQVDVIVSSGGTITARAAMKATRTIPIIFHVGPDPVAAGLVESLSRPGGNATGVALLTAAAWTKRLELAATIAKPSTPIGVLFNPGYKGTDPAAEEMQRAAQRLGRQLMLVPATKVAEVESGLEGLKKAEVGAVLVSTDPFLLSERDKLAALALKLRLATITGWREQAIAGSLMSYGTNLHETYRESGLYTARVLKGEKPANLPVLQATRLYLLVNLKTAKALGIDIPPLLMALADEVIE